MIYICRFSIPYIDVSSTLTSTITVYVDAIDEASAFSQSLPIILKEIQNNYDIKCSLESNKYNCTYRFYSNHRESFEDYIRNNNPSLDFKNIERVLSGNDSFLNMEYINPVKKIMFEYIQENFLLYIKDNTVCSLIELNKSVFNEYGDS